VKPKLEDAINTLKKEGANAYVVDLRGNPGGAFQSAVEIAGIFVNDKIATTVVDGNQVEMPFKTSKDKALIEDQIPMVLWLDGGSASASEVLAGALHDTCRSVTMGQKSYGKGLIQAVYGLKNGTGLVLTVAKYVTPNGSEIQGVGIVPDIEAKLPFLLIPGFSSDTSKVDFQEISNRLEMCLAEEK
jgi:carboxyl-terminal processing protease